MLRYLSSQGRSRRKHRAGQRGRSGSRRAFLVAVAISGLVSGCAGAGGREQGSGPAAGDSRYVAGDGTTEMFQPAVRKAAPEIKATTFEGTPYRLSDRRGKIVVVNFWASWCAPCRAEAPALQQISQDYRDEGVEVLGIDIKDGRPSAKAFLRTFKITYPTVYDQPGRIPLAFWKTVPPNALPSTLIVDREGKIAARIIGETKHSSLNRLVSQVVAER
jgi:thiol-disulfide isomerase/thioredoxin